MKQAVQTVVAMRYSVTVSAAEQMMPQLYEHLFSENKLSEAIRKSRLGLYNQKERQAAWQQTIELEDWILPVVYQNKEPDLKLRPFTPEEEDIYWNTQSTRFKANKPKYDFTGRDLDILEIEKRLLTHNFLLVNGMVGVGKTTLLTHLGEWWQRTNFVEEVFYYDYGTKIFSQQTITKDIAQKLYSPVEYTSFLSMSEPAQQSKLAKSLMAIRHLLI